MTRPPAITSQGRLATTAGTAPAAADRRTASAATQLHQYPQNHVNRPPGTPPHGPLATTNGTGLMTADQQAASTAQLRTRRETIGIHLDASVGRPPAGAAPTGIRRTA